MAELETTPPGDATQPATPVQHSVPRRRWIPLTALAVAAVVMIAMAEYYFVRMGMVW